MCFDVLNVDKFSMFLMNGPKATDKVLRGVPAATRIMKRSPIVNAEI